MNKSRVVLVKLPFTSIVHTPSLALAVLKSANEQKGIKTTIIESEIDFAELMGQELFADLAWPNTEALFFDSLFSSLLFPDSKINANYFLETFKNNPLVGPKLHIAQKHDLLKSCRSKGEYLFTLFNYLQPICVNFIDNLAQNILTFNPAILGSTSVTEQTMASLALFNRIKNDSPGTITVMGGFNCEGYAGKVLVKNFKELDVVFAGEGENEFPAFCQTVLTEGLNTYLNKNYDKSWNKYNAFSDKKDVPPKRLSIDSMENSPTPDFKDFIEQLYAKNCLALAHIVLPFTASRGCWWGEKFHCSFCGLNDETLKYKSKSPEKMYAEIMELHNKYGARNFVASDLILPTHYYKTFVEKLGREHPHKFSIYYQVKSNMGLAEVSALKKAGIDNVQPGIENFDNEELKRINKGVSGIQNIAFLKYCTMNKMTVSWNILFDKHTTPQKKLEELEAFLPSLFHLYPPYTIRGMNYPRDSMIYKNRLKNKLTLIPHPLYKEVFQLNDEDAEDFAYMFVDQTPKKNLIDYKIVVNLNKMAASWKAQFSYDSFLLNYTIENDGRIKVIDRRLEEVQVSYFEPEDKELFEQTIEPVQLDYLLTKLNEKAKNPQRLEKTIERLLAQKLFYLEDNKILNLIIPG